MDEFGAAIYDGGVVNALFHRIFFEDLLFPYEMKIYHILPLLLLATVCYAVGYLILISLYPHIDNHRSFAVQLGLLFFILTLAISWSSLVLVDHKNPYYFSWVTLLSVLIKLIVGIGMIVWYRYHHDSSDISYVAPFLWAYVVFTVAEVVLGHRIINSTKRTWQK